MKTHEDTHQRETLRVHPVWESLPFVSLLPGPCQNAPRGPVLSVPALWESFLLPHILTEAHEETHCRETL